MKLTVIYRINDSLLNSQLLPNIRHMVSKMAKKTNLDQAQQKLLRLIPKVDECLSLLVSTSSLDAVPLQVIKDSIREVLAEVRQGVLENRLADAAALEPEVLEKEILKCVQKKQSFKLRRIINCTGVVIHTNLGRSILPESTMEFLKTAGLHYSNLEFDIETGERGSRYNLVEELLCELTGSEAALVVNNNAAAVLIVLETLANKREVIVSRGQLVEIGGAFRIPDVMARSGATLVEVGATNRTHIHDYEQALSPETALLLKVHCSNYKIIGFTKEVSLEELVALGRANGVLVVEDLGSGCLVDLSQFGLAKEPTVQEVVKAGVDVVTFSGDKLLGGPQAGIILGKKEVIAKIKKNPLNRAMRIDKFTLAGLESVLRFYRDDRTVIKNVPSLAMIAATPAELEKRSKSLLQMVSKELESSCKMDIISTSSRVGGGAMPEQNLESRAVALRPTGMSVNRLEGMLRTSLELPILGRIEGDRLIFDMRTVADAELPLIAEGLRQILR